MRRLTIICFLFVSLFYTISVSGQTTFPISDGEHIKYSAYIEMQRAYISGICVLQNENNVIKGCLFNEFGLTAIDFSYNLKRQKVKLHSVFKILDKWYIRRVLRKDIAQLMMCLQKGETYYQNESRHINYQFTPIADEVK